MDLSDLGVPIGPMVRVDGGFANRMYRLDTDQGSFAVKELNLDDRRWTHPVEDVFRFERVAFAAGIPMPEPISATDETIVHRWVEGEKVPEAPVSAAYALEIGEILARLHSLHIPWNHPPIQDHAPGDWSLLAKRAKVTGQPWAEGLAAHVATFLAITNFINTCERPGPVVLSHRDIQPWNLLVHGGRPVVLDWELSGLLDLSSELGSSALSLAKGPGLDDIKPVVFRSVLEGYVVGGGALPPPGPSWFVYMVSAWLAHTRWNILRCLAGVEATTGPDLALSHASVNTGIHGLPELFERLPELEARLLRD
ncbi:aminoglycoside phosphotransferase (APT) family kinase protein [Paenarthrobacter nicotinovorans]|uniref:Aminoglycoside phosphotransferase (APT) family kinase protein n=1 Tax=Paenarthrobacter nicotinovorans TaxID=29320 RepID=A0ABT9TN47_PAENI|nr:phosphotransferase [Paenarthrobacter nicotinovorans]MDQ0103099.1 aminoglycoside phosphotransferase (APT) family kinase protein [Paenarthrobacter nicotinovorans]